MGNTITYSSELMKNYVQASIMAPDDAFEALQDGMGNSLLFSIGSDGVFYVTQEVPAINNTNAAPGTINGWTKTDLSTAQLSKDFTSGIIPTCKNMAVNQNNQNGTIGLAMVVTQANNDTLYLCVGNSNTNTAWLSTPVWVQCPFNYGSPPAPPSPFTIVNIFISETLDGQYIVADIANGTLVQRYYITQPTTAPQWNLHSLSIDLSTATPYSSCIGRNASSQMDGMYTFGQVSDAVQFIYCPLWNQYGSAPPSPTLLNLPDSVNSS